MKLIKITLLILWIILWTLAGIDNFVYHKDLSVFSATLLITLLFLAYNLHKGISD